MSEQIVLAEGDAIAITTNAERVSMLYLIDEDGSERIHVTREEN